MKKLTTALLLLALNLSVALWAKAESVQPASQFASTPTPGPISGPSVVCANQAGVAYSVPALPGTVTYAWTVPAGATIASGAGTESIVINFGPGAGDICVTADDGSGASAPVCLTTVAATARPSSPDSIVGPMYSVCPGQVVSYSVLTPDPTATSYDWIVPPSMTITSGQGTPTITVEVGPTFTWGYVRVSASNCRGTTGQKVTTVYNAPTKPGAVSGPPTGACPNGTYTYSIQAVPGATSYTWFAPTGCSIASPVATGNPLTTSVTSVDITFPAGFVQGSIFVQSNSGCNSSERRELKIRSVPVKPGGIRGPLYGVCDLSNVMYYVDSVPGAESYTWTFTPGTFTTINGNGNDTIYVDFAPGFNQATLCVTANNSCGSSVARCGVVFARPQTPRFIDGPTGACNSNPATSIAYYEIQPMFGATGYDWTVPPGANITLGQGTTRITVDFLGASTGNVSVRATNDCGVSPARSLEVIVNPCRTSGSGSTTEFMELVAYPNPARGQIQVAFQSLVQQTYSIRLFDLTGREVLSFNRTSSIGANREILDLSEFTPGIYLLDLNSGEAHEKVRIIVE
jgi:hypothetical protein